MISSRAQRASSSAFTPASHQCHRLRGLSTRATRSRSSPAAQSKCHSTAAISVNHTGRLLLPKPQSVAGCPRSVNSARHGSTWIPGRRVARAKYTWHRPGCSWVSSEGDPKKTARDKDCPACQEEEKVPFEYSSRELMYQRHREQMDAFRRQIEKDPYEALFGWSNRRINALWSKHPLAALKSEMDSLFPARSKLHSDARLESSDSGSGRKIPIQTENTQNQSTSSVKAAGNPNIEASMTWRTSTTDASGRTHEESGDLVYDPISNRMVPRDQWFAKASPTAIGKGVDAQSAMEQETSKTKYARPSSDAKPNPDYSNVFHPKMNTLADQMMQKEAGFEQAKERASSAIGVEDDAARAAWNERRVDGTPTPTNMPNKNAQQAPIQKVASNADHMNDKHVIPSQDPTAAPIKSGSSSSLNTASRVVEREAQSQKAKQEATSTVAVEEDAQRTGRASEALKSERPLSAMSSQQISGQTSRLETSLNRHLGKASNNKVGNTDSLSSTDTSRAEAGSVTMQWVRAQEQELDTMKQKQNLAKAKHDLEQSWKRQVVTDAKPGDQQVESHVSNAHKGRSSLRDRLQAWTQFKSGCTIDARQQPFAKSQPAEPRPWRESVAGLQPVTRTSEACNKRLVASGNDLTLPANAGLGSVTTPNSTRVEEQRLTSSLSLRREKPLKLMSFQELVEHKAYLSKEFSRRQRPMEAPNQATCKMQDEVTAFKSAMNAFENNWRLRTPSNSVRGNSGTTESKKACDRSAGTSGPEPSNHTDFIAGEGDMCPNVVQYARNGRWYKDRAPHAKMISSDAASKDEQLVTDIQTIYENAYGTINDAHRQESPAVKSLRDEPSKVVLERKVGFAPTSSSEVRSDAADAAPRKSTVSPVNPVNSINKTTRPEPDLTPQTGNFASPTGFVNHDRVLDNGRFEEDTETNSSKSSSDRSASTSASRRVRREEPVFSGQLSAPKYTIPEVVEMLRQQGLIDAPRSVANSPPRRKPSPAASRANGRSKTSSDGWSRGVRYTLVGGGFGAAICYTIGLMIEYAREPRVAGGYDGDRPTWDSQRSWRGRQTLAQPAAPQTTAASNERSERTVRFSDTPLRGFEYPMMGLLVACIWYILSSGGS